MKLGTNSELGVLDFLREDNGNMSTMRIVTMFIVFVMMGNWTYFNIVSGVMNSFSWENLMVIVAPLIAKGYQKSSEQKVTQ
jgi:hypothetical protein